MNYNVYNLSIKDDDRCTKIDPLQSSKNVIIQSYQVTELDLVIEIDEPMSSDVSVYTSDWFE